jgi:hypothetical protein
MNSSIILLAVVLVILASRKRKLMPVTVLRILALFAAILIVHVAVIGGLMAFYQIRHF